MFHVIIPTYNREKTIERALKSVINQKYSKWCIYVIDDGSIDHTRELLKSYLTKYKNKIFYTYKENGGVGSARNIGIRQALGNSKSIDTDLTIFLDSDDEITTNAFDIILDSLEKYENYKIYFFDAVDHNGNIYSTIDTSVELVDYKRWLKGFRDCGFSLKLSLLKNEDFRFALLNGYEGFFWNTIFKKYENNYIGIFIKNMPILKIHISDLSLTRISKRDAKWLKNSIKGIKLIIDNFGTDYKKFQPKVYGKLNINYAEYIALDGKKIKSIKYFIEGIKYFKNSFSIAKYILALLDYKMFLNNILLNKFNNK